MPCPIDRPRPPPQRRDTAAPVPSNARDSPSPLRRPTRPRATPPLPSPQLGEATVGRTVVGAPPSSPFLPHMETRRICRARAPTLRPHAQPRPSSSILHRGFLPAAAFQPTRTEPPSSRGGEEPPLKLRRALPLSILCVVCSAAVSLLARTCRGSVSAAKNQPIEFGTSSRSRALLNRSQRSSSPVCHPWPPAFWKFPAKS